jgi:sugar lactone lactonase YvrE
MTGKLAGRERKIGGLALVAFTLFAKPAPAELRLPPGFAAQVYVTGQGFATGRSSQGIPATSTLVFDRSGMLFLARTGARYQNTETDDLAPVYRVPPGGARMTPETELRYFYGPPLRNPQTVAVRGGFELFVTTFDRDRRLGVVYRLLDGRAELFAGGTPPRATPPLLRQPEGAAVDSTGRLYVADRESGRVLRLDPAGRVLDPHYVVVQRPRVLAVDANDVLWIGADGNAEAPWQQGPGEIWRVPLDGPPAICSWPTVREASCSPSRRRAGAFPSSPIPRETRLGVSRSPRTRPRRVGRGSPATCSWRRSTSARGPSTRSSASPAPSTS